MVLLNKRIAWKRDLILNLKDKIRNDIVNISLILLEIKDLKIFNGLSKVRELFADKLAFQLRTSGSCTLTAHL